MTIGMLPNTILIGAQKCATTSLHWYLGNHPEIEVARRKPLGFFVSREDDIGGALPMNWHRGVEWYKAQCPETGRIRLESTPDYTNFPSYRNVPERMYSVVPDARLIYIVRNPIKRLISQYVHDFSTNLEHRPFDDLCKDLDDTPYVHRSMYHMQLQQMLRYYDLSRILIITQEGLRERRSETLAEVFRFLGVEEGFRCRNFQRVLHSSTLKRRNNAFGVALDRVFGRSVLDHLHGRQRYVFRTLFYTPFSSTILSPELRPDIQEHLFELFSRDLEQLARLTGQPFDRLMNADAAVSLCHNPR